jgi:uncharacterized protein YggE
MKRFVIAAAGAAVLAAGAAVAQPAMPVEGDAAFRATTLTLSSFGEARTAPDQASISLGVTTEGATAAAAMTANRTRMNAVIAAVRGQGVEERDIQTSGLNLNPQYVHREGAAPRITGYQASNQVTLNVRDLARLGPVVDAVVGAGANQINGISFGLQNTDAASDDARRMAVRNLQRKAEMYAQAAGYRIVRLVTLAESGGYIPRPRPMMREMAMATSGAMDATSVQPGEVQVRVDVTAVYEMAPR